MLSVESGGWFRRLTVCDSSMVISSRTVSKGHKNFNSKLLDIKCVFKISVIFIRGYLKQYLVLEYVWDISLGDFYIQ